MPITAQQADSLRSFLIEEMQRNGYNDVIRQVNVRLERNLLVQDLTYQSYNLLMFFIDEILDILRSMSIEDYGGFLEKMNLAIEGPPVRTIVVRGLGQENISARDLASAPNYEELIRRIREIRSDIRTQNESP